MHTSKQSWEHRTKQHNHVFEIILLASQDFRDEVSTALRNIGLVFLLCVQLFSTASECPAGITVLTIFLHTAYQHQTNSVVETTSYLTTVLQHNIAQKIAIKQSKCIEWHHSQSHDGFEIASAAQVTSNYSEISQNILFHWRLKKIACPFQFLLLSFFLLPQIKKKNKKNSQLLHPKVQPWFKQPKNQNPTSSEALRTVSYTMTFLFPEIKPQNHFQNTFS